jgi:hypothetical protein
LSSILFALRLSGGAMMAQICVVHSYAVHRDITISSKFIFDCSALKQIIRFFSGTTYVTA